MTSREAQDHVGAKLADVLEILRPMRVELDARGYRAVVTAHDTNGRITLTVEVTTIALSDEELRERGRSPMFAAFAKAFESWEDEFRAHPERFMTAAEVAALAVLPLAEQRTVTFEALLNTLSAGRPWQTIGEREDGS